MPPIPPQRPRVLMLQEQLQVAAYEHDVVLLALIRERERQQRCRRRRWWVRPWIERRRLFGQYETLFQELERESWGGLCRIHPNGSQSLRRAPAPSDPSNYQVPKVCVFISAITNYWFCFVFALKCCLISIGSFPSLSDKRSKFCKSQLYSKMAIESKRLHEN